MQSKIYQLEVTTQGPTYPPSEIMDKNGNFVVIGIINDVNSDGELFQKWGGAIVSAKSPLPPFGKNLPYNIIKKFDYEVLDIFNDLEFYTLPLPLPCNNYQMNFAPEQNSVLERRKSYPLHQALIPDFKEEHGRRLKSPIMLSDWVKAMGTLCVSVPHDKKTGIFEFEFDHLIPNSLYTIMALREHDLDPANTTRPGPLGVPNVFISDENGKGRYCASMPNPFPIKNESGIKKNRIISVVLLWMSTQMSYGGAIGRYGLGGDIHAQLKLPGRFFDEFETHI